MSLACLPAIIMSVVAALVGVVHLFVYARGAGPRHHQRFGITCLAAAVYGGFSAALYSADTIAEGAVWQHWQLLAVMLGGIALVWFVQEYAGLRSRAFSIALTTGFVGLIVLWIGAPRSWFWADAEASRVVSLPFGITVLYHEVPPGPLFLALLVLGGLTLAHVLIAGVRLVRRGNSAHGWRLLIGSGIFFVGIANDACVTSGIYSFVYVLEYTFLALVLLMSQTLVESAISTGRMAGALRASRQAYREILDSVQDAIFIHEAETGRILDVNEATTKLFGMTRDELRAAAVSDLSVGTQEETSRRAGKFIHLAVEQGPQLFEWHSRRSDGSEFWVEVSLRAAEIGGEPRVIALVHDISDRKASEEALVQSRRELTEAHNMLQTVLDTIPTRVFWKSRELIYMGCNRLFARDAGLESAEQVVGRDDLEMPWRAEAVLYRQDDVAVIESEKPRLGYEEPQTTPEGLQIWLHTSKMPLRDADGNVIGVIGVYEDISERRAEQEALRRSEENLTITLNSIGDGVIAADADGHVVRMNPVAEQLTGWSIDEARGRALREVFRLASDTTGKELTEPTARILAASGTVALDRDAVLVARDGSRRLISDSGAPIRDRLGRMAGVVLVFRDVTDERALQDQVRQAQKMEAIGRLAGGVAHDFNNLLQAIEGYRSLASAARDDPDEVVACLDDIGEATERAAALTRQLLAFSRHDTSEVRVLELGAVIRDMTRLLDRMLGPNVRLEVDVDIAEAQVQAGASHIEQILLNLALNAKDAMPAGGKLIITIRKLAAGSTELPPRLQIRSNDFVVLNVRDTGCGIPADIQDRVFEPFFTTKEVGAGTGLGLATVYALVERLQGEVKLVSAPKQGTTFSVYLPAGVVADELEPAPALREDLPPAAGETLLLAEDDEQVRKLTARVLRRAGYTVHVARDGEEALAIFRRNRDTISLVIADVIMPRRGGLELLAEVRALRADVPVVFSTGYGRGEAGPPTTETNQEIQEVITKPYDPADLVRRVRSMLDRSEGEDELDVAPGEESA